MALLAIINERRQAEKEKKGWLKGKNGGIPPNYQMMIEASYDLALFL